MSVPTSGEEYSRLTEYLRLAQESAYTLSHLARATAGSSKDRAIADGYFAMGELLKRINHQIISIAQGKLQ